MSIPNVGGGYQIGDGNVELQLTVQGDITSGLTSAVTLTAAQLATVRDVIGEVGARDIPELIVFNKIDLVDDVQKMALRGLEPNSIAVSARSGEGIAELEAKIASLLPEPNVLVDLLIPYNRGDLVSRMHLNSRITKLDYEEEGTHVQAMVSPEFAAELAEFARK